MLKLNSGLFIYNSEPIKLERIENSPAHWPVCVFSDHDNGTLEKGETLFKRKNIDPTLYNIKNNCLLCPGTHLNTLFSKTLTDEVAQEDL